MKGPRTWLQRLGCLFEIHPYRYLRYQPESLAWRDATFWRFCPCCEEIAYDALSAQPESKPLWMPGYIYAASGENLCALRRRFRADIEKQMEEA